MTQNLRAWAVVFAGFGVNLTLGFLYAWGIIAAALVKNFGWNAIETQIPYMLASLLFAFSMVPAGRLQDRRGPRVALWLSALLAGTGFLGASFSLSVFGLALFFGVLFGLAMGFGYAAPTPAAVKWFHPQHRGFISGIVVSGYGIAPVYIAPLAQAIIERYGLSHAFLIFGCLFAGVVFNLSFLIADPPSSWTPLTLSFSKKHVVQRTSKDFTPKEMVKTKTFALLWVLFLLSTFAGLLVIGQMPRIAEEIAGFEYGFVPVALHAVANFLGRLSFGPLSDRWGRSRALSLAFFIQTVTFFAFENLTNPVLLLIGKSLVGFTFGGMLVMFPAACADYFGLKNLGANYGLLFTAWGVGGIVGPLLGGLGRDLTGGYTVSFFVSGCASLSGIILSFLLRREKVCGQ
ncbi:MAG: L-lactate MFS transporter [Candidatus Caldatribacteriaceae bacterium]